MADIDFSGCKSLIKNWQSFCDCSSQVKRRGLEYFQNGFVKYLKVMFTVSGNTLVKAQVESESSEQVYSVKVEIDRFTGTFADYSCECRAYEDYSGMCKHCIAAIFAYDSQVKSGDKPLSVLESLVLKQGQAQNNTIWKIGSKDASGMSGAENNLWQAYQALPESLRKLYKEKYYDSDTKNRYSAQAFPMLKKMRENVKQTNELIASYKGIVSEKLLADFDYDTPKGFAASIVPVLDLSRGIKGGLNISFLVREKSKSEISTENDYRQMQNNASAAKVYSFQNTLPLTLTVSSLPRAYVVKNIGKFSDSVFVGERISLGKALTLFQGLKDFDESGLKWINYMVVRKQMGLSLSSANPESEKTLCFRGAELDDLFDSQRNCYFKLSSIAKQYVRFFSDERPVISVSVTRDEFGVISFECDNTDFIYFDAEDSSYRYRRNSYPFSMKEDMDLRRGRYVYVMELEYSDEQQNSRELDMQIFRLKRFSMEESSRIGPFLKNLISKNGKLQIPCEQLEEFNYHVLSEIGECIEFCDPLGVLASAATPDKMQAKMLLDAPDKSNITAVLLAGYGGVWIDMNSGKAVGIDDDRESALSTEDDEGDDWGKNPKGLKDAASNKSGECTEGYKTLEYNSYEYVEKESMRTQGARARLLWDVSDIDTSKIRRNHHAEQRFLVAAGKTLGLKKDDLQYSLAFSELEGALKAGSFSQPIMVSGDNDIYEFLTEGIEKLEKLGEVLVTDKLKKLVVDEPRKISVGVALRSGLLKLKVETDDIELDELRELLKAYHEKKSYYRLRSGSFLKLRDQQIAKGSVIEALGELSEIQDALMLNPEDMKDGEVELPIFRAMYLEGLFSDAKGIGVNKDEAFENLTRRIKGFEGSSYCVPESLKSVLRAYQINGYRWLKSLEACSFCGILADDMGLGKSVQFISLLLDHYENTPEKIEISKAAKALQIAKPEEDKEEGKQRKRLSLSQESINQNESLPFSAYSDEGVLLPSMIVCPASLLVNWKKEIEKFAPCLRVVIIQGKAEERAEIIKQLSPGVIAITSYDLLRRDAEQYGESRFYYFVIDEAQYIKNHATLAAKAVKKINCVSRFALTGTPIENRLSELWSIFDFLMPGYLYKYSKFREHFEVPITKHEDERARANLRRMVMPFVLRRLKSEVLTELPPKTSAVVPVALGAKQKELYEAVLQTGIKSLRANKDEPQIAKIRALALLTKLRRLCCDPSLCYDNYKAQSAKLDACMELMEQASQGGHRVLLFSQYTDMLDIIQHRLIEANKSYLRLQGSTPVRDRGELVDRFNEGQTDVFLISLKAGGTGLNLTAADTVIHYDPWWNVAAQDQATDRAYRIGQKKHVQVYKLIAQDTIEEKILQLQQMKKDLASILQNEDEDSGLMSMSADQIIELLQERNKS